MLKRVYHFLSLRIDSPERAAGVFALLTFFGTLLGILRERLLATVIGPGAILDAYVISHKIPDFLFATTASLASVTILLPHLVRLEGRDSQRKFMSEIFTVFFIFTTALSIILIIFIHQIMPVIAPGFTPETLAMSESMSRFILISPIFMGIANILGAGAQLEKQFVVVSLAPVMYNLGTVLGVWIGYPILGPIALPLAILIGAFFCMGIQLIVVHGAKLSPRLTRSIDWRRVWHVFSVSIPRTFAISTTTITELGIASVTSKLAVGSVSLLNFAVIIQNVPVTFIGLSLATASFPVLVDYAARGDRAGFSGRVAKTFRIMSLIALPLMSLLMVLRTDAVTVLFAAGKFSSSNVAVTAQVTSILVLSVLAQSVIQFGARVYYAHNRTWRPFMQNVIGMVGTLAIAFAATAIWGPSLIVLSLSMLLGWTINAVVMWYDIWSAYGLSSDIRSTARVFGQGLLAAVLMGFVAYGGALLSHQLFVAESFISAAIAIAVGGIAACAFYVALCKFFGISEIDDIIKIFAKKFLKRA